MKQKGSATFIFIGVSVIVILLILIGVASFFIIAELTQPAVTAPQAEPAPVVIGQNSANQPTLAVDANNNGIPDNVEKILGPNIKLPTTAPATPPQPVTDTNNNGIPDDVERILGNTQK